MSDLLSRAAAAEIASCDCLTKTSEPRHHQGECRYRVLREMREEILRLRAGLWFYAKGHHFGLSDEDAWDTVSGEPPNWWCDEAGTATIEDGTIARQVLEGFTIREDAQGELLLEPPQPVSAASNE